MAKLYINYSISYYNFMVKPFAGDALLDALVVLLSKYSLSSKIFS